MRIRTLMIKRAYYVHIHICTYTHINIYNIIILYMCVYVCVVCVCVGLYAMLRMYNVAHIAYLSVISSASM